MDTLTTVQPALNFGGLPFDSFGPDITPIGELPSFNGGIEIKDAPEDGLMSVTIEGDTDHFFIRDIYVMEWVMEPVDPGELPPGFHGPLPKVKVLEVVNFSDGKTPVQVMQHQYVLIRTSYASGETPGTFNAIVTIEADNWETIVVPLSLFIADVNTQPSGFLNIPQGGRASLPFMIQSTAGPSVDVHFEMSPTQLDNGLTLAGNNFSLFSGETKTVLLEFTANTNAPIGTEQVALDQWAFRRRGFFFTANITHAQVTINPLIPNKIFVQRRGTSFNIPISVQLNNGPAVDIHFSTINLPSDISMQGFGQQFFSDEVMQPTMVVGNAVPDEFNFMITWETQWGQTGSMSFFVVIIEAEEISLHASVVTDDGIALGGNVDMILRSNGNYTFKGSMEASGLPSYNYGIQVFIKAENGIILTAFHSGSVFGTDTPGDRNDPWEENLNSALIKAEWLSIRNSSVLEYQLHADIGGVIGTVWDIVKAGLEVFVGFMVGGVIGAGIVLGGELASAAGIQPPPGVVAGIAVVAGTIVIFGAGAIIPAVVAGAAIGVAVELLIKSRPIHPDEMDFARCVFGTALDDAFNNNKIWLTNLSYDGGRKYTISTVVDGLIIVNLDTAFDDPVKAFDDPVKYPNSDYTQPGSVFIHELTHACQIAANNFTPGMICNGSGTYTYHNPDGEANRLNDIQWASLSWTDFTREQQAHIVDDWYGAFCFKWVYVKDGDFWRKEKEFFTSLDDLKINLNSEEALNDPAFHFITQCRSKIF
jgi:hypothetical protein